MTINPLLVDSPLPPFSQIKPEHVEPAICALIQQNLQLIETLLDKQQIVTWENLVEPLEEMDDHLNKAWSPVSHLNAVANTKELREVYNHCLPKLSDYATQVGQNQRLYQAYLSVHQSKNFSELSVQQQKVITNALRDFTLSGIALSTQKRELFATLSQELAQLQSKFQDNVMDATDRWHEDVMDIKELQGMPAQSIELAELAAQKANVKGWRLTLDYPCYQAVITFAENRALRQKIHRAYYTRASDLGDFPLLDNSKLMEQILAKRHEMANLLDYKNFATRSLAKKMAKTPEEVMNFLQDLANKAKTHAQREFAELQDFAKQDYGLDKIEPWDIAYFSEKLRQKRFALSQETLRPYFPVPTVLAGMFEVVKRLYGIQINEINDFESWNSEVRLFEVTDNQGEVRGQFYIDLFARNHKRGGAWMDEARVRRRLPNGRLQLPVAYLTCNFRAPIGDVPSLLTFEEVLTLFHEFGHGLHHLLTKMDCASVSGINGVAWDAVELPSQFMENWCWEKEALAFISGHFETGKPLPAQILAKMFEARNFQSAMMLLRQIEFSLFDFRLHLEYSPDKGARIQEILDEVRDEYSVVPVAPYLRFQHTFCHIFSGGYAAGYYSYLWAEVLSQDAFAKFEEEGIFNRTTGEAFLHKILEKGGSVEPDILFKDFRGRPPKIEPLLRHRGLSNYT